MPSFGRSVFGRDRGAVASDAAPYRDPDMPMWIFLGAVAGALVMGVVVIALYVTFRPTALASGNPKDVLTFLTGLMAPGGIAGMIIAAFIRRLTDRLTPRETQPLPGNGESPEQFPDPSGAVHRADPAENCMQCDILKDQVADCRGKYRKVCRDATSLRELYEKWRTKGTPREQHWRGMFETADQARLRYFRQRAIFTVALLFACCHLATGFVHALLIRAFTPGPSTTNVLLPWVIDAGQLLMLALCAVALSARSYRRFVRRTKVTVSLRDAMLIGCLGVMCAGAISVLQFSPQFASLLIANVPDVKLIPNVPINLYLYFVLERLIVLPCFGAVGALLVVLSMQEHGRAPAPSGPAPAIA